VSNYNWYSPNVEEVLQNTGQPVVRAFPFAYDSPNILTGYEVYTPTAGEVLLDAWVVADTPWVADNPSLCDISTFTESQYGWFDEVMPTALNLAAAWPPSLSQAAAVWFAFKVLKTGDIGAVPFSSAWLDIFDNYSSAQSEKKILTGDPIKIVVSQDGTNATTDAAVTAANTPTLPLVVTGANDNFVYDTETFAIVQDTYTTLADLADAIGAATGTTTSTFSDKVTVTDNGTKLVFTLVGDLGANGNGLTITGMDTDTGLADPTTFAGGVGGDPNSTQGSAILYLVTVTPI